MHNEKSSDPNEQRIEKLRKRVGLGHGLGLQQFEKDHKEHQVIEPSKGDIKFNKKLEKLMDNGHIPEHVRIELNLPKDMRDREVDYKEVHKMDLLTAIKRPEWSGQDVLVSSLNNEQSSWVVNKLNSVRVWP